MAKVTCAVVGQVPGFTQSGCDGVADGLQLAGAGVGKVCFTAFGVADAGGQAGWSVGFEVGLQGLASISSFAAGFDAG